MGTNADVLRLALSRLDIDVALGEILHFLTNDDRLPGRTRKAVQFLHGLREQMVLAEAQKSNPELFDCPLASKAVETYTFAEVRQRYAVICLQMGLHRKATVTHYLQEFATEFPQLCTASSRNHRHF